MDDVAAIRSKFEVSRPFLDERRRRLWAAAEALVLGHGGITAVATATGLQRATIRVGIRELQTSPTASATGSAATQGERRVRAPGGGRTPLTAHDPDLVRDLEALVEPVTRGDPMSPLRWTCKSTRQLAAELVRQGHQVSHKTVTESCSTRSTTACRPPARPRRKPTTPTATPSSPTSTTKLRRTSSGTNR